jgi:hypothetical protein
MTTRDQIDALAAKAESGAQWAEVCRLEAEMNGGPFFCQACGCEIGADETPCRMDYPGYCLAELRAEAVS